MSLVRELESRSAYLHSDRVDYNDGSVKYHTWVTLRRENFRIQDLYWDTVEAKDAYVLSMVPRFGEVE